MNEVEDPDERARVAATFVVECCDMIDSVDHGTSSDGSDTPVLRGLVQEVRKAVRDYPDSSA